MFEYICSGRYRFVSLNETTDGIRKRYDEAMAGKTPLAQKIMLTKDLKEMKYRIDHIAAQLETELVAYHLADKYYRSDLQHLQRKYEVVEQIRKSL